MPNSRSQLAVHITPVVPTDVGSILHIEQESFDLPWGKDELRNVLRNATLMVARHERRVVGYIAYQIAHRRAEIWNLAVHPGQRRRGIGRQLVAHVKGRLEHFRLRSIRVEVLEHDRAAQDFYRAMDFRRGKSRICCEPTIRYSFRRRDVGLAVLRSILEGDGQAIQF